METKRLEAFSDGVIAIIITLTVFNVKAPVSADISGLLEAIPAILVFALSFLYLAIYWNNHHHMFQAAQSVNGSVLWANMHLLFWLSLFPFVTTWIIASSFSMWPVAVYGTVLLMAAIAYWILQTCIVRSEGCSSLLRQAIGRDWKGRGSLLVYVIAVMLSFWSVWLAMTIYVGVALVWLVPDKRIERAVEKQSAISTVVD